MNRKAWQEQAIQEQAELDRRGQELFDFVGENGGAFDKLNKDDRTMLVFQLGHMQAYNEALTLRISFFEDDEDYEPREDADNYVLPSNPREVPDCSPAKA